MEPETVHIGERTPFLPDEEHLIQTAFNIVLQHHLTEVLEACASCSLEAIVLKGLPLAERLYEHSAERPMADIDILIHPFDKDRVGELLKKLDYEYKPGNSGYLFGKRSGGLTIGIDVHTGITCFPDKEAWDTAVAFSGSFNARVLSPEYELLYLCYHIVSHHGLACGHWLRDIHLYMAVYAEQLDWDGFMHITRRARLERTVYWCFKKASLCYGTLVPEWLMDSLRDRNPLVYYICSRVCARRDKPPGIEYLMPVLMGRKRDLLRIMFPAPAVMRERYCVCPGHLFAYYIARPCVLVCRGIRGFWSCLLNH